MPGFAWGQCARALAVDPGPGLPGAPWPLVCVAQRAMGVGPAYRVGPQAALEAFVEHHLGVEAPRLVGEAAVGVAPHKPGDASGTGEVGRGDVGTRR
jgi:hypothetical protein